MPKTTILPDKLPVETPHYQRFVAFTVQFPIEKGKRIYHRVVITGTHKDIAQDLGTFLPSRARTILERSESEELEARPSKRRMETTTPKRESYYAVCSCGVKNCEHLTDAIKHFFLVQDFAENTGQVIKEIRDTQTRFQEASEKIEEATQRLESVSLELTQLEAERSKLEGQLHKTQDDDEQLSKILEGELEAKSKEITEIRRREEAIRTEKDTLLAEKEELERTNENLHGNLDALTHEMGRIAARGYGSPADKLPDNVASVVSKYFALKSSDLEPESKLAPSVYSDHHKASNVEILAKRLSGIDFIKYIGISYRREARHNKVTVMPDTDELELIVADSDNANIFKLGTTAQTKAQQLLAAHLVAEQFNARVETK